MELIHIPMSPGELLDKITILEIKSERMSDAAKLDNVRRELQLLNDTWQQAVAQDDTVPVFTANSRPSTRSCGKSKTTSATRNARVNSISASSSWRGRCT